MENDKIACSRGRRESQREGSRSKTSSPRKRSYQREHNARKGSYSSEHRNQNDDLRSPCHKQPRCKGQKENTPKNKQMHKKEPWNIKNIKNQTDQTEINSSDFPPLGIKLDGCTPESSKDWGTIVEENEKLVQHRENNRKPSKIKRRLMLSDSSETTTKEPSCKQIMDDKSKARVLRPIITDPHKLAQRQKQIDIGKNTVSYGQYIKNVPREKRSKEDPWTPDKFQQCSTRSWVGQIKVWRRRLHSYDPSSDIKEDLFSSSSTSSSQATDEGKMEEQELQPKLTKNNAIEDMFKNFDLESCLMEDDGFPR